MLNSVCLVGRLTKDPELRKTRSNKSCCSFTLACDRDHLSQEQRNDPSIQSADFISVVSWGQSADYLCKYGKKGNLLSVTGRMQTRSYSGQSGKTYVTEVNADGIHLLSYNKQDQAQQPNYNDDPFREEFNNGYQGDEYLPFK